jgi:YHS domain-containing protein
MTLRSASHSISLVLLLVLGAAVAALSANADEPPPRPAPSPTLALGNRTCPVEQTPVDPKVGVVWNGLRVGLCCPDCIDKFKTAPEKYTAALLRDLATQLAEAKAQLAATTATSTAPSPSPEPTASQVVDLANATCPVMGGKAKENVVTTYHGMKVHFCCPGCDRRFQADPQKYLQVLRKDPRVAPLIDRAEAQHGDAHGGHGHH